MRQCARRRVPSSSRPGEARALFFALIAFFLLLLTPSVTPLNADDRPGKSRTGSDLFIKDLGLGEDLELYVVIANAGEVDVQKGSTIRMQISINYRKVCDFEHLTTKVLKSKKGNRYLIHPPYAITLGGVTRVKASARETSPSRDAYAESRTMERTFVVHPFTIEPKEKEEFSFSIPSSGNRGVNPNEKVRAEARWEGTGFPLKLSLSGSGLIKSEASISGKSPLKMATSMSMVQGEKSETCLISVRNLLRKKVVGHVIVQHP